MPTKCSVSGCENFYSKGVPFFDIPSPLKYKFSSEKADLSKKRRKLWLDAMGIKNDSSEILRICSKHFVTGKPATLEKSRDVDWVPTLHMKLTSSAHKKRKLDEDNSKSQKGSSQRSNSAKRKVKHSKTTERRNDGHGKTEGKITKRDIKNITKRADSKKYLNCKVLLDGDIQNTTFKGTNGSGLTVAQKHGEFTSDNITVNETSLNNTVLRIHLIREDLDDLKSKFKILCTTPNKTKRKAQKTSSFGRQIKRKVHFFEDSYAVTSQKKNAVHKPSQSINSENEQNQTSEEEEYLNQDVSDTLKIKQEVEKPVGNSCKTLNRTIKKNYRDKIKIKLFPKTSLQRQIINGSNNIQSRKSRNLKGKILFVKKLKRVQLGQTHFLKFNPYRYLEDGKLDYSFQKLVTDVKHMKLPALNWKIKVIIKQGKISAITFTNKLTLERCVGFTANSDRFRITIDNKPALLLGSPDRVRTSEDLEILLDIVENIDSMNPMIFYK